MLPVTSRGVTPLCGSLDRLCASRGVSSGGVGLMLTGAGLECYLCPAPLAFVSMCSACPVGHSGWWMGDELELPAVTDGGRRRLNWEQRGGRRSRRRTARLTCCAHAGNGADVLPPVGTGDRSTSVGRVLMASARSDRHTPGNVARAGSTVERVDAVPFVGSSDTGRPAEQSPEPGVLRQLRFV